jgi:hypothetical protein
MVDERYFAKDDDKPRRIKQYNNIQYLDIDIPQ